jgi:hypothetical protein
MKSGDTKRGAGVSVCLAPLTVDVKMALENFAGDNAKTQADSLSRLR